MKVYLLQEEIDLGNHTRAVSLSQEKINDSLVRLDNIHKVLYGKSKLFIEEMDVDGLELSATEKEIETDIRS